MPDIIYIFVFFNNNYEVQNIQNINENIKMK